MLFCCLTKCHQLSGSNKKTPSTNSFKDGCFNQKRCLSPNHLLGGATCSNQDLVTRCRVDLILGPLMLRHTTNSVFLFMIHRYSQFMEPINKSITNIICIYNQYINMLNFRGVCHLDSPSTPPNQHPAS